MQDINRHYKNGKKKKKKYYEELIFKSKNKTKTTWKIIKEEIGNNCQNSIKSLNLITPYRTIHTKLPTLSIVIPQLSQTLLSEIS